MKKLTIGTSTFPCAQEQSVLDTLLEHNVPISYSCKKGICLSCLIQSTDTTPPEKSQDGLKTGLQQLNYFLACQCYPEEDMALIILDTYRSAKVTGISELNHNTLKLEIQCENVKGYFAGQFANLRRADGLTRSYSIANVCDTSNTLEFHLRHLPGGKFSTWARESMQVGDTFSLSMAHGHCIYFAQDNHQTMLLVGAGSGLAPLYGIIHDALRQGHKGDIYLYHGVRHLKDLYLSEELQQLALEHANFHFVPCLSAMPEEKRYRQGRADQAALKDFTDLTGWRVYLCGHPQMVQTMKKQTFLKGAAIAEILSDAFVLSDGDALN